MSANRDKDRASGSARKDGSGTIKAQAKKDGSGAGNWDSNQQQIDQAVNSHGTSDQQQNKDRIMVTMEVKDLTERMADITVDLIQELTSLDQEINKGILLKYESINASADRAIQKLELEQSSYLSIERAPLINSTSKKEKETENKDEIDDTTEDVQKLVKQSLDKIKREMVQLELYLSLKESDKKKELEIDNIVGRTRTLAAEEEEQENKDKEAEDEQKVDSIKEESQTELDMITQIFGDDSESKQEDHMDLASELVVIKDAVVVDGLFGLHNNLDENTKLTISPSRPTAVDSTDVDMTAATAATSVWRKKHGKNQRNKKKKRKKNTAERGGGGWSGGRRGGHGKGGGRAGGCGRDRGRAGAYGRSRNDGYDNY